jgi:methionine synthase I (cobalamin-dependent)
MAYADIKQRLDRGDIIILDGATGTELQRRGAPMDAAAWCGPATLQHHGLLTEIHRDYIEAGADVVAANTFAASRLMLGAAGLGDRVSEVVARAVAAALEARKQSGTEGRVAVAGSLSHMVPVAAGTDVVDPAQVPSTAAIADAFHEVANHLKTAGVDHIMLEMMYNPVRTPLAAAAALSTGLPVWFGASARRRADGGVLAFDKLEEVPLDAIAAMIPDGRIDVAGIMHTGSDLTAEALAVIRSHFSGPLSAYPDSGYFAAPDWRFVEDIEPLALRAFYLDWLRQGVQLIGGCCGTGLAHIRAAAAARQEFLAQGNVPRSPVV